MRHISFLQNVDLLRDLHTLSLQSSHVVIQMYCCGITFCDIRAIVKLHTGLHELDISVVTFPSFTSDGEIAVKSKNYCCERYRDIPP